MKDGKSRRAEGRGGGERDIRRPVYDEQHRGEILSLDCRFVKLNLTQIDECGSASTTQVSKFGTLTCHISNNSNFMELTFQPVEL